MKFIEIFKHSDYSDLAKEFEVAETTVHRWAQGETAPHPKLQRMVIAHVLHGMNVSCDCDKHRFIERCPYHRWFE